MFLENNREPLCLLLMDFTGYITLSTSKNIKMILKYINFMMQRH